MSNFLSTRRQIIGAGLLLAATGPVWATAPKFTYPIKLAVFEFEFDDFSVDTVNAGDNPDRTRRLHEASVSARKLLADSGLFEIISIDGLKDDRMAGSWLHKCGGCEAPLAASVGAEMSMIGIYRKLSIMAQTLEIQIRLAATGEVMKIAQTDYRGETDESWARAVKWLVQHRIIEPQLALAQK